MVSSDFAIAVHSMLLLAAYRGTLISSSRLSGMLNVHAVRVRRVLSLLRDKGYIESREGANGGFSLLADPADITLRSLYELTQSDILKPKCHDCSSCSIGYNIERVLGVILAEADGMVQNYLDEFTLQKVLDLL